MNQNENPRCPECGELMIWDMLGWFCPCLARKRVFFDTSCTWRNNVAPVDSKIHITIDTVVRRTYPARTPEMD